MANNKKYPRDFNLGINKFEEFTDLEAKDFGQFSPHFKLPHKIHRVGLAAYVCYQSRKWSGKNTNYIHEIETNVHAYRSDVRQGPIVNIPKFVQNTHTLVRLGYFLGYAYHDGEDLIELETHKPYPDLYCTPNGKCLIVVANKSRLIMMLWGGKLGVEDRGIVG